MTVAVLGMGYVGCVTAAVLAREGNDVVGVDIDRRKIALLSRGEAPVLEQGLAELVRETRATGRLQVTSDLPAGLRGAEIIMICVGTPSAGNGSLDTANVERVARQIGAALDPHIDRPVIVLRSTILPGAVENVVVPALAAASTPGNGAGLALVVNPEFLREGQSLRDFYEPEFTLIGTDDAYAESVMRALYAFVSAPMVVTDRRTAALVKYASNAFHAVKVAFANEVAAVSAAAGADGAEVMRIFCLDRKLNLSKAYLRPGAPFGGSCLPKDLRALAYCARRHDLPATIFEAVIESNRLHTEGCIHRIRATRASRVGVLGLAFKAGTDDVRESPMVAIVEGLLAKGVHVAIYDRCISLAGLVGANREYLSKHLPHITSLLRPSLDEVVDGAEVLVVGNSDPEFRHICDRLRSERVVIDLAGLLESRFAAG